MDNNFLASHIKCTIEEKKSCMNIVNNILELAQTARCCGLLELEKQIESEKYQDLILLKTAVLLIVDGTDPVIVKEIIENYLITSQLSNKEFLENLIICKGVLAIQQGENLEWIKEKCCSLFGIEFREEFMSYFKQEKFSKEVSKILEDYEEKLNIFPKTNILDFIPDKMDNRSIQRLIREISFIDLEYAMIGSNKKVLSLFLNNMGKQGQKQFFKDIENIHKPCLQGIEHKQREIVTIINKLAKQGEIILGLNDRNILSKEEIDDLLSKNSNNFIN